MDNQELLAAIRTLVREEVNAAVYASEQRINERLNKVDARLVSIETRLDKVEVRFAIVETRLNKLEGMVMPMAEHLKLLGVAQTEMQTGISSARADLKEVKSILNIVTIKINEFERTQISLEHKVEIYLKALEHDRQEMYTILKDFTRDFIRVTKELHARIDFHEKMPLDEAHPGPAA